MSLDTVNDIWAELRRYISTVDRAEAADAMVNLLIDHDYRAEEIKSAFKGDNDVKRSLESYLDDIEEDLDDEDDPHDDEY